MFNGTVHEQPQRPESPEKDGSAGPGNSFSWMKRMMAACKQMRATCCGEPEETKPPTSRKEETDAS